MGNRPSYEERLASAKHAVENNCPIEVKFPGIQINEAFLQHQKNLSTVQEKMPQLIDQLVTFVGGPTGGGTVVKILISIIGYSTESLERALILLNVDKQIAEEAHTFVNAKMKSIERQLSLLGREREPSLAIADNSCYELLVQFNDPNSYLRRYPFALAPFLATFVATYIAVTRAKYQLIRTCERQMHREDVIRNLETLSKIIEVFQDSTGKARVNYIITRPVHGSEGDYYLYDSMIDKEIYYQYNSMFTDHLLHDIHMWYEVEVKRKYTEYFAPSLKIVAEALKEIQN